MAIDTGDTAWMLISSALVLLMTPGLALFYGGMARRKNLLSTIMMSLSSIPLGMPVWWFLITRLAESWMPIISLGLQRKSPLTFPK